MSVYVFTKIKLIPSEEFQMNIAVMGYGVVGRGTARVFEENASLIEKRVADKVNVKYILDLLDFPGDKNESKIIHDFEIIVNDPDVSVVAEVMGGRRAAYTFTKRLLEAKKSVVTSNKELVAYHGDELLEIASANGVRYMFEASVGGGIPLLSPMIDSLCANEINAVCGIVNGTSNYILTEMTAGKSFAEGVRGGIAYQEHGSYGMVGGKTYRDGSGCHLFSANAFQRT